MSTGLPMTCTPMTTITDMASSTNSAWISRRISQVVIGLPSPWHVVSFPPRLLQDRQAWVRSDNSRSRNSNLELIGFVREYLDAHGIGYRVSTDATGQKANVHAVIGPQAA